MGGMFPDLQAKAKTPEIDDSSNIKRKKGSVVRL